MGEAPVLPLPRAIDVQAFAIAREQEVCVYVEVSMVCVIAFEAE